MTDDRNPTSDHEEVAGQDDGADSRPPAPSTFAGRRAQEAAEDGSGDEARPRVTDEIEAIKRAIAERADDGLADMPKQEPPEAPGAEDPAGEHEWAESEPEPAADPEPEAAAPPATKPGETIETDTLVHSDQEAAQEAALEAVRARAAAHEAKQASMPPPATAAGAAAAGAGGAAAPPAAPPTAVASGPPRPPARPAAVDVGKAPKGRLWLRFLAGAILIVVSMASATAVSGLVLASKLANGLAGLNSVQRQLTAVDPGQPQTILILGSDKRPGEGDRGRSDTTILLRVDGGDDPNINLLSIPRDLRVDIPGYGTDKFNAAYSYGGPKLTTETVKQLTGLPINVVVNINFTGFADAVNEIGCVYVDVDHHYYHSNVGLSAEEQYSEIDIPSGYQRMCGFNALSYVRYRHDDNDLVRSARQQAFLREARAQVPISRFLNDYNGLIDIFTKYTTSTIRGTSQLIGLANLFLSARSAPIKEIHFPGDVGDATSTYVTASHSAVQKTVQEFLGETPSPAPSTAGGASKHARKKSHQASRPQSNLTPQSSNALVDASSSGHDAAAYALKTTPVHGNGKPTGVPVYYPTQLPPGAQFLTPAIDGDTSNTRGLTIDGGNGHAYFGYKIVADIQYGYTSYFGVSGTNWTDAPILDNPSETKTVDGREYDLYYDNGRLRQVAFREGNYAYWVENDLLETLTADQMMGMAESMTKYTP